jgi:hypothetical protein
MIEASCHCGAIRIEVEVDARPDELTSCNCAICRRLGTLWADYPVGRVRGTGDTATYRWGDRSIDLHRCRTCGCVTHWSAVTASGDRMGVNARLMAPEVTAAARVRRLDGADTWEFLDD